MSTFPLWMKKVFTRARREGVNLNISEYSWTCQWIDHFHREKKHGVDVFISEPYQMHTKALLELAKFVEFSGCKCLITKSNDYELKIHLYPPETDFRKD